MYLTLQDFLPAASDFLLTASDFLLAAGEFGPAASNKLPTDCGSLPAIDVYKVYDFFVMIFSFETIAGAPEH